MHFENFSLITEYIVNTVLYLWSRKRELSVLLRNLQKEQDRPWFCFAGDPHFLLSLPKKKYISYILGAGMACVVTCVIFDFCKGKK